MRYLLTNYWILRDQSVLRRWSQLENIFSHYKTCAKEDDLITIVKVVKLLTQACDLLESVIEQTITNDNEDRLDSKSISFV